MESDQRKPPEASSVGMTTATVAESPAAMGAKRVPVHPHGETLWPRPRRQNKAVAPFGDSFNRTTGLAGGRGAIEAPVWGPAQALVHCRKDDDSNGSIAANVANATAIARRCNELIIFSGDRGAVGEEVRRIKETRTERRTAMEEEERRRAVEEAEERATAAEKEAAAVMGMFGARGALELKERREKGSLEQFVKERKSVKKEFTVCNRLEKNRNDLLNCYENPEYIVSNAIMMHQLGRLEQMLDKRSKEARNLQLSIKQLRGEINIPNGKLKARSPEHAKVLTARLAHAQYLEGAAERSMKRIEDQRFFFGKLQAKSTAMSEHWISFLREVEQRSDDMEALLPVIAAKSDELSSIDGLPHCKRWLQEQKQKVTKCLEEYEQVIDGISAKESARLEDEVDSAIRADNLLRELLWSVELETKLTSEKMGSDLAVLFVGENEPDEKLVHVQRIDRASKRSFGARQRYQALRKELDVHYRRRGRDMASVVDFVEGAPPPGGDGAADDRPVVAVPRRRHLQLRPSVTMDEWTDLFLAQPWLERQMADESRGEARRRARRRILKQRTAELAEDGAKLEHDRARARVAEDRISELQDRLKSDDVSAFKKKELEALVTETESVLRAFLNTERDRKKTIVEEENQIQHELSQLKRDDEAARQCELQQKKELDAFMLNVQADSSKLSRIQKEVELKMQQFEKRREMTMLQQEILARQKLLKAASSENKRSRTPSPMDWSILDTVIKDKNTKKPREPLKPVISFSASKVMESVARVRKAVNVFSRRDTDPEVLRMMTTIRKSMARQNRKVEAICDLRLTVGKSETDEFSSSNIELQAKGKPYFRRIKHGIGTNDQIVIWMKKNTEQKEFITKIVLGHMNPGHEEFVNGHELGMLLTIHDRMRGTKKDEPCIAFWHAKDQNESRVISDMGVSYTRKDRKELAKEGYDMIGTNLQVFGLAPAHLHVLYVDRPAIPQMTDTTHMAQELQDYSRMLSNNPNDPILQKMVEEMQRRLHVHQLEEEARARCTPVDPIVHTVEFLALDETGTQKFEEVFRRIDNDNDDFISVEEFVRFLQEPTTMLPYFRHIFTISEGATPEDDKLGFGVSLKGVATFCMLSPREVLQFVFSLHDKRGQGIIASKEFLSLISMFHPQHRGRAMRALREFDLPSDGHITFSRFRSLHETFPHLMYPAFRAQERVKIEFLGVPWWERKLRKYMAAKEKVQQEQNLTQS